MELQSTHPIIEESPNQITITLLLDEDILFKNTEVDIRKLMYKNKNVLKSYNAAQSKRILDNGIKNIATTLIEKSRLVIPESLFLDDLYDPLIKAGHTKSVITYRLMQFLSSKNLQLIKRKKCKRISLMIQLIQKP
jgi:hypothetical protein